MNIAIIRHIGEHAPNKNYAFALKDGVKLPKGTLVKVETLYGDSYGTLVCDSFDANDGALDYILTSCGAKKSKMKPIKAVLTEIPVCETKTVSDDIMRGFDAMRGSSNEYSVRYDKFPVTFRAKRKDNGEWMESPCLYTTAGNMKYLGTRDTISCVEFEIGNGNIFKMMSADDKPLFIEIEPDTLDWKVEK